MKEILLDAFPSLIKKELSDEYIIENSNLFWEAPKIPFIRAVPLYMLWCVENSDKEGEPIFDDVIGALNTFSRSKVYNFKAECNKTQVSAVIKFLEWSESSLLLDYEPTLQRAMKNWQAVNKALNEDATKVAPIS